MPPAVTTQPTADTNGQELIDVAIPVHPKDAGTVHAAVNLLRRHCSQIGDVYIVGPSQGAAPEGTTWVRETIGSRCTHQ